MLLIFCWYHVNRYSSYSSFLHQSLAGLRHSFEIDVDAAHDTVDGLLSHITFAPASVPGLRAASAKFDLRHGQASINWQRHGGVQCAQVSKTSYLVK